MKYATLIVFLIAFSGFITYNYFSNSNQQMDKPTDITPSEFQKMIKNNPGIVIDVRTDAEYNNGHLNLANYQYDFTNGEFERQLSSLNKKETYYLYCRTGNRSGQAARLMKENGFENVYNVGGFEELADEGFETE